LQKIVKIGQKALFHRNNKLMRTAGAGAKGTTALSRRAKTDFYLLCHWKSQNSLRSNSRLFQRHSAVDKNQLLNARRHTLRCAFCPRSGPVSFLSFSRTSQNLCLTSQIKNSVKRRKNKGFAGIYPISFNVNLAKSSYNLAKSPLS